MKLPQMDDPIGHFRNSSGFDHVSTRTVRVEQPGYKGGHPSTVIDNGDGRAGQRRGVDRHKRRRNGHHGDTFTVLAAMNRGRVSVP
jgi:hypothetical protein